MTKTNASAQSGESATARSVKDQVYEQLRLDIISFALKPGERISEVQLAERLGVGLASVRAVLPRLVQEGLVINKRRMGHMISPITMQDVRNVCQLREMLEPQAAALAAKSVDVDELIVLDEASRQTFTAGDRDAEIASLMANRDFHTTIARASGNELLSRWIEQLHDLAIRFQYLLRQSPMLSENWNHSHDTLIAAFRNRDPFAARQEMEDHLKEGSKFLLQAIMQLPNVQEFNLGELRFDIGK